MTSPSEQHRPKDRDEIAKQIALSYQREQAENDSFLRDLANRDWAELSPDERDAISYIGELLEPDDTKIRQKVTMGIVTLLHLRTEAEVAYGLETQFGDVVPHPVDQKPVTPIE